MRTLAVLAITAILIPVASNAQSTWTWRNPLPAGTKLLGAAHGPSGRMVAVGEGGTLLASPDGINWTAGYAGTSKSLLDIAWTGSAWVAVGESGTVLLSSDGTAWSLQDPPTDRNLACVVWTGRQLIAAGDEGTLLTSGDGRHWTPRDASGKRNIRSLAWTGTFAVAGGDSGAIWTSVDGNSWTARSTGSASMVSDLAWTGDRLVALSKSKGKRDTDSLLSSSDGVSWDPLGQLPVTFTFNDIVWTGDLFAAVGVEGIVSTSPDGIAWTGHRPQGSGPYPGNNSISVGLNVLIWTGEILAAFGRGVIITSQDGVEWTFRNSGAHYYAQYAAWTGNRLVVLGGENFARISPDGITYTLQPSQGLFQRSMVWTGTRLIALGDKGAVVVSDDGTSWSEIATGAADYFGAIVWTGTRVVAVGKQTVATSQDGLAWTVKGAESLQWTVSMAWTGKELVAVGDMIGPSARPAQAMSCIPWPGRAA